MRPLGYPPTIPNVLRHAAREYADREFVITAHDRLTFAQADRQSRRLAQRLLRDGVGKGTPVGLLFPQSADFVVAFLAVTRIGALAVPLSTFLRGPELHRALRFLDVDALLAPAELLGREMPAVLEDICPNLRAASSTRLFVDDLPFLRRIALVGEDGERSWVQAIPAFAQLTDDPAITAELFANLESEVAPSDRLLIVQTSGATAAPKGVVHTHAAQVLQSWKLAQLYELTSEARSFTTMPFFWVGGLTVVLLTHLHVGATVIAIQRTDSTAMLDLIEATRPTRLLGWTLPERLRADPTFADRDTAWLSDLIVPTAPLTRHGSLGMTETSGPHTAAAVSANQVDLPEQLQGSFGPPVAGMEHKIVDEAGATVGEAVEGEICVRGDALMDGLHKRLRSEAFDADGWYHTGDRGCLRDGLLFFTGRLSEMIKTGGANVAPREVELAIESLPGVKAAFVVGVPDADRGELVACLVCPEAGEVFEPESLRTQLAPILSSYKIPRRVLVTPYDDAPWLSSGKINKAAVVELFAERTS
jgi:acyl-CoA synthetase (AMP-forming)/AMP-acid ligase II